jgi:hypothetical protein
MQELWPVSQSVRCFHRGQFKSPYMLLSRWGCMQGLGTIRDWRIPALLHMVNVDVAGACVVWPVLGLDPFEGAALRCAMPC